jgi:hypothetical protein
MKTEVEKLINLAEEKRKADFIGYAQRGKGENLYRKRQEIKSISILKNLLDDCPWNQSKGLSNEEFIIQNFTSLKKYTNFFTDIVTKIIKEVVFINYDDIETNENKWVVVYYFGKDKKGPIYFLGGKPEKSPIPPLNLQKHGWKEFPQFLIDVWNIHGTWSDETLCCREDFGFGNYYPDEPGTLNHFSTHNSIIREDLDDHYLLPWDKSEELEFCIEFDHLACDEYHDMWQEDYEKDRDDFVYNHFKDSFCLTSDGEGNPYVITKENFKNNKNIFHFCHGADESYFLDFWEYII